MPDTISAIILMGGKGERFGSVRPKQFHKLSGKPVFIHTLHTFIESSLFHEILLVSPQEWIHEVERAITKIVTSVPIKVISGGATRRESSYLGLLAVAKGTSHVVIHDAVRPFVSGRILRENISSAIEHGAVDTCIASADTIVYAKEASAITDIPRREHYLRGQTPQSFALPLILRAHEEAIHQGFDNPTDDCSLVHRLGEKIHIVQGDESNIKITTELDLYIAEQLLRRPCFPILTKSKRSLQGKTYVITGGTGGIGSSIALALEREGAHVCIVSRRAASYPADLTRSERVKAVFNALNQDMGEVDGLINCVGALVHKPLDHHSDEEIISLIETNLLSLIFCCRYARVKSHGHVINVSSSSYFKGRKDLSVYSATKAAVVNFTQALAEEREDLKVNVIIPQRTLSPMRSANFPKESEESLLLPTQIADKVIGILQDESSTGMIYEVRKEGAVHL